MGDTVTMCSGCFQSAHTGRPSDLGCQCPCHPPWEYGDCDHGVVERGWEHEGMALPVRFPEDKPLDGCER